MNVYQWIITVKHNEQIDITGVRFIKRPFLVSCN